MATLTELQTKISARLLDTSNTIVSLSQITDALNSAISTWKYKRFWFNTKTGNITLTADNSTLTPPADLLIELPKCGFTINYGNTKWPIKKISPDRYNRIDNQSVGLPEFYTWEAGVYSLYYIPDQGYTVICKYLEDYDDLSASGDSNDFTNNAEDLIMYDALAKLHGELRQDEKMESYYSARANNEYKILRDFTSKNIASGELSVDSIL